MSRPLTEKTLELINIMAELAYLGRRAGYRPYFIGYSQLEEIHHGVDTHFNAGAMIGFFQFKRAYRRSTFFTFYINNNRPHFNQHRMLLNTNSFTNACRYVFPLVDSNADVHKYRGQLLRWTAFLPPQYFGKLSPPDRQHRVRLYLDGRWERYSEFEEGIWENIYGELPENIPSDSEHLLSETVLQNLNLPNMETTLVGLDNSDVQEIFRQRSSFCMVLD